MMMLRTGSRHAGFSPDVVYERPAVFLASKPAPRNVKEKPAVPAGCFTSRLLKNAGFSAARFFRRVGANMVKAIHFISGREFEPSTKASPRAIPQGFAPPRDSHHSEAIEDCIKFINSTSRRSL